MANDVQIILDVVTTGVQEVSSLSNALQQLNRTVEGARNPMRNLDARARALSKAIGSSDSSLKNHAKSVSELTRNQAILSNELGRVSKEINGLGKQYVFATGTSNSFRKRAVADLVAYQSALKGVKARALVEDLKSVAQEQKRLGKDAQFVGRSLIIGLTTPIMGFARVGLQSLISIDKEFVRLNKVLETVAPNLDAAAKKLGVDLNNATVKQRDELNKMVLSYQELNKSLTATSTRYGIAKSLTVGLAGDYAELGIQAKESIASITDLTAATEKLGNMDIGAAQDLVQSLYFQAIRAMQMSGESRNMSALQRETAAIGAARAQLALFNAVENTTALTLRDLGDAFPEVAAAASSFGLSMTEAAAMLAPMKAAGFDIGASANSIKVSLQRIVAPTKQNADMFKKLSEEYKVNFNLIKGTGVDAIQTLIDAFNELRNSAAGQEGVAEFFAKVFGVRQGPRMEVAISQLAELDSVLKDSTVSNERAEKQLQSFANQAISSINLATNANLPLIKSYKDIAVVARIATAAIDPSKGYAVIEGYGKVTQRQIDAAIEARNQLSDQIFQKSQKDQVDLIGQVATEAGRAMFIQLAGVKNAQAVADRELEASLSALDTKIKIIKNNFKMLAADVLQKVKPAFETLANFTTKLYDAWTSLDSGTKSLISGLVIGFATVTAAIGPLVFIFGQFRLAMGTVSKVLFGFLPGLKTMSIDALASRSAMMRLTKPIELMGDTVYNTNNKFATFIATLASGEGPVARMAEKIGLLTGVMQKQNTAPLALNRVLTNMKAEVGSVGMAEGLGTLDKATAIGKKPPIPVLRTRTSVDGIDKIFQEAYQRRIETLLGGRPIPLAGMKGTGLARYPKGTRTQDGEAIGGQFIGWGKIKKEASEYATRFAKLHETKQLRELKAKDLEAYQLALRMRDQQLITIAAQEKAARDTRAALRRSQEAQKGLSTTLGRGQGGLFKQRMLGKRDISEETYQTILQGGLKGRLTSIFQKTKGRGLDAADFVKSGKAISGVEKVSGKFLGGKQFVSGAKGVAGFGKGLLTSPIDTLKSALTGIPNLIKKSFSGFAEIGRFIKNPILLVLKFKSAILAIGPAIVSAISSFGLFTGVGVIIAGVVAGVILVMKNWETFSKLIQPGINAFKETFSILKDAVMGLIQPFIDFFATMVQGGESGGGALKVLATSFNVVAEVVKFLANVIKFLFVNIIGKVIRSALSWLIASFRGIANLIKGVAKLFSKDFAEGFKQAAKGVAQIAIGLMGPFSGLFTFILKGIKKVLDALGSIPIVGAPFKKASKMVDSAIKFIESSKSMKKDSKITIGAKVDPKDTDTRPVQEKITNSVGNGMKEGADKGAKAIAKKLKKELINELQETIASKIKDKMDAVVESITDSLKQQKESSLKIYDDQIQKIDDIQKAEERLTKVKEYENRRREIEEQRALNALNFARQKALAIYEGRIDDARQISLEQVQSEKDSSRSLTDLTSDRTKQIADEQRQDLIDAINDAKKKAGEYFDDMIKKFQDGAKKITEFPPTTAEEFNAMLNKLINGGDGFEGAKSVADRMGTTFSSTFTGQLANLGVNSSAPLTASLQTISDTLIANNPFGENGVWQTTIRESIDSLTRKYSGLANTLTMIVDESSIEFQTLFDTYSKYKSLVDTESAGDTKSTTTTTTTTTSQKKPTPKVSNKIKTLKPALRRTFATGGLIPKAPSQSVPAILHGGEYIVNAGAVRNIGLATLEAMNNMRFKSPTNAQYNNQPGNTYNEQNININVDTFIGERAWFETMMKDYNIAIAPQNQKNAGLQNRKISTYTGLNRGM